MLVESGISAAPPQRPRAPDARHMAPASVNARSRDRRTEPLAAVIESSASSDDSSNGEDDSQNEEDDDNASGEDDDNANADDDDDANADDDDDANADDDDDANADNDDDADDDDDANADDDDDANADDDNDDAIEDDNNPDADEDDNDNDNDANAHNNDNDASAGDQHGQNDEDSVTESDNVGKDDKNRGAKASHLTSVLDPQPGQVSGTPARVGEPTTAVLPVSTTASVASTPLRERNRVSGTPARGGELTTSVLPVPIPSLAVVMCEPNQQGCVILTATSMVPTPTREPKPEPSIGKDSGTSTTDLGPIGEGSFFLLLFLSLFIFYLVLSTEPLADNGINVYFNSTSCFKVLLDIDMGSPIPLEGASCTDGGIL